MEEAKARRIEDEMTDTEFMLNRDIVKKLEADKKLVISSTLGGGKTSRARRVDPLPLSLTFAFHSMHQ